MRTSSPLKRFRRAQRQVRSLFEPFTRLHCPTCATPCCVKPARIRPLDLILVEELVGRLPGPRASVARPGVDLLESLAGDSPDTGAPCDFLTTTGCAFPADLRPTGCVTYICEPMHRLLPASELAELERAVAEVQSAADALQHAVLGD